MLFLNAQSAVSSLSNSRMHEVSAQFGEKIWLRSEILCRNVSKMLETSSIVLNLQGLVDSAMVAGLLGPFGEGV